MSTGNPGNRSLTLVRGARDEDYDEEQFKPLEWGLLRRLFVYTLPVKRKFAIMVALSLVRSMQLPALIWVMQVRARRLRR